MYRVYVYRMCIEWPVPNVPMNKGNYGPFESVLQEGH